MEIIKIVKVEPLDDYTLIIIYENGVVGRYDCNWILSKTGKLAQDLNDLS